jgi:Chaperone of endosialidase
MNHFSKSCLLFLLSSLWLHSRMYAQQVYTITADSVKLTSCDSSELIIMNHTQNVPGFLFNTGHGRTIFQRGAQSLGGGVYVIGADTIKASSNAWVQGGNSFGTTGVLGTLDNNHLDFYTNNTPRMRLTNTGNIGIGLTTPAEALDVYGNVNINPVGPEYFLASYKINDQPVLSFGSPENMIYNICVGDSSGYNVSGGYGYAFLGYKAGMNNVGAGNTLIGQQAGMDDSGSSDTFVGAGAGISAEGGTNTFIGAGSCYQCTGAANAFLGTSTGYQANGSYNMFVGPFSGANANGSYNVYQGYQSGDYSWGDNNILMGQNSGYLNGGSDNVFVGNYTGHTDSLSHYGGSVNQVTLIGDSSDVTVNNVINATAIGHKAIVRASNTMVFGDSATTNWFFNTGASPVTGAALVVGSNSSNGNGAYLSNGGTWTNASDRNKKENFQRLDGDAILKKISHLPLTRWNYKGQSEQHIGPVAQDFYRIFQVGENDKTISTIDPSGIALIGVQELYKKWKTAEKKSASQHAEIEKQQATIEALQSAIQSQEERLRSNTIEQNHEIELLKKQMDTLRQMIASHSQN